MTNPDFRSKWVIALSNMTFVVRRHVKRTKRQGVVVLDYLGAKHWKEGNPPQTSKLLQGRQDKLWSGTPLVWKP